MSDLDVIDDMPAPALRDMLRKAMAEIEHLRAALQPFAEPHAMGDNYVRFAPRLIDAARAALKQK